MASIIFADHGAVANPDVDLIKVGLTMRTGDNEHANTGTIVLTPWAATQLVASLYEALKESSKRRQAEAVLIDMKKAKAKLAKEPGLKGA